MNLRNVFEVSERCETETGKEMQLLHDLVNQNICLKAMHTEKEKKTKK